MSDHIVFDANHMRLKLLDQRLLPARMAQCVCDNWHDVINAIKNMAVRGAPAIGVAAAYGCAMAAAELARAADWQKKLDAAFTEIASSRPTAVNLSWAVERMRKRLLNSDNPVPDLIREATAIHKEDLAICKAIGKNGETLLHDGDTVLTHCNAGALATAGYGTALGIIRAAREAGKDVKVIADETRPLLQGARLTAWELKKDGIHVKLACDNACAALMDKGLVQLAITGADRIAANGDTANKIGTLGVAIICRYFNIPFYVAAPLSTIDPNIETGDQIPIEQRSSKEALVFNGERIAPEGVDAFNFAFDITPADLIAGIVTEAAILRPPYGQAISQALERKGNDNA